MRGDTSEIIYKTMREVSKETSLADILILDFQSLKS